MGELKAQNLKEAGLTQGLLHLPGITYESQILVKKLVDEDRETHHCFYGRGYHNHLSHQLLAAYDLGATARTLQAIYDKNAVTSSPINTIDRQQNITGTIDLKITTENWTKELGVEKNYIAYVAFFKDEVNKLGVQKALETYVFSEVANEGESRMLFRLVGGAVHPFIQIGYGLEFNDPSTVASGLAQAAVHSPSPSDLYDFASTSPQNNNGLSLLGIIKEAYESPILKPVMPYDNDALIRKRMQDALSDGRPEEIRRLVSLWTLSSEGSDKDFDDRVEEIIWLATLLTAATGKHGRKPRLDFFLMHLLTSSLFLPSYMKAITNSANKVKLLKVFVPTMLFIMLTRGRPRIDPTLIMSYTEFPHPPGKGIPPESAKTNGHSNGQESNFIGDPHDPTFVNPWTAIIAESVHAVESHVVKAIRSLYYAAQRYGATPPGGAIGAFDEQGNETLKGTKEMDGTIFVRAAGVLLDTMGWVTYGQKAGSWDRTALGWDAAWDNED